MRMVTFIEVRVLNQVFARVTEYCVTRTKMRSTVVTGKIINIMVRADWSTFKLK